MTAMAFLECQGRARAVALLVVTIALPACSDSRNVVLSAKRNGPALEFELVPQGGLSIGNVEVWDVEARQLLWKVLVSRRGRTTLTYGVVPLPEPQSPRPKQFVPDAGQSPPAIVPGHRLFVVISGHYSNSLNPGAATLLYAYVVTIGDDDSFVSVMPRPRVMYSDVKMLPPTKTE